MTISQVSDGAKPRPDWLGLGLTASLAAISAAVTMAVGWGGLTAAQATTDRRLEKLSVRVEAASSKADEAHTAALVDKATLEEIDGRLGRIETFILTGQRR